MKRAALAAHREVVRRTPIDTGRARTNWIATNGEPASYSTPSVDFPTELQASDITISEFKLEDRTIYITNNLVYIQGLEDGRSKQAPNGMATQAIVAAVAVVRASKLATVESVSLS